jgi:hypothetical protein
MSVLPVKVAGPVKLGVAAVNVEENVEGPEDVNGPVNVGVAAFKEVNVPKEVRDEFTIVSPKVVADKTSSPSIL